MHDTRAHDPRFNSHKSSSPSHVLCRFFPVQSPFLLLWADIISTPESSDPSPYTTSGRTFTMSGENHNYNEQAAQRWRQHFLEAWRGAPLGFGPAVDGVSWNRIRPGEEAEDGPRPGILSILQFTLKHGIDMRDESGSPRKFWDASLSYIESIPGCCAVEWGLGFDTPHEVEAGRTSILCLIHWDSTTAWRTFQYSLGFEPILALLDSAVSNRCARLGPSGPRGKLGADARGPATVVDVVSVDMAAEGASSPERRLAFEEAWNTLVASATNGPGHDGLLHSYAVWLENNAMMYRGPIPTEEPAAVTTRAVFTAFLLWDGDLYDSRPATELCDKGRAYLSSFQTDVGPTTTISRKAFCLANHQTPQPDQRYLSASQQPATQHSSLASILNAGFTRQYSARPPTYREQTNQTNNHRIHGWGGGAVASTRGRLRRTTARAPCTRATCP